MNIALVTPLGLILACLMFLPWWWRPWRTYWTPKILVGLGVALTVIAAAVAAHPSTTLDWTWTTITITACIGVAVIGGGPVTVINMSIISWYQHKLVPYADTPLLLPGHRGFALRHHTGLGHHKCRTCGATRGSHQPVQRSGPEELDLRIVLPGGAWLGVCERLSICVCLLMAWPEGILVVVGLKGIGRYQQIVKGKDQARVAERFLLGTFFSVLWSAGAAGIATLIM